MDRKESLLYRAAHQKSLRSVSSSGPQYAFPDIRDQPKDNEETQQFDHHLKPVPSLPVDLDPRLKSHVSSFALLLPAFQDTCPTPSLQIKTVFAAAMR